MCVCVCVPHSHPHPHLHKGLKFPLVKHAIRIGIEVSEHVAAHFDRMWVALRCCTLCRETTGQRGWYVLYLRSYGYLEYGVFE